MYPMQEGLELPDAVPGSGSLQLVAGVGYLPALSSALDLVAQHASTRCVGGKD